MQDGCREVHQRGKRVQTGTGRTDKHGTTRLTLATFPSNQTIKLIWLLSVVKFHHAWTYPDWFRGSFSPPPLWMSSRCLQVPCETSSSQFHGTASSASLCHSPPFHDEAGCRRSQLSAASLLSYITKVNSFSGLHGSSISRIIFCVSWQFCVCRVMCVCFGIGTFIEPIRDISISRSSLYFDLQSCMCLCGWFVIVFF